MARMTKKRPGFKTLTFQLPDGLWAIIEKQSTETGESATKLMTLALSGAFGFDPKKIPKPKKSGRKPKPTGK